MALRKKITLQGEYPERGMTSSEYETAEDKWLQLTLDDEAVGNWKNGIVE